MSSLVKYEKEPIILGVEAGGEGGVGSVAKRCNSKCKTPGLWRCIETEGRALFGGNSELEKLYMCRLDLGRNDKKTEFTLMSIRRYLKDIN